MSAHPPGPPPGPEWPQAPQQWPPAQPPQATPTSALQIVGFFAFGLLWLALCVLRAVGGDTENAAEFIGYVFGGLFVSGVLAALIRLAYVKLASGPKRFWSPWLFLTAAVIAFVFAVLQALAAVGDEVRSAAETPERAEQLLEAPPAGYRLDPAPASQKAEAERLATREGAEFQDVEVRRVVRDGRIEGAIFAAVSKESTGNLEGYETGFEKAGGRGGEETIAGTPFYVGSAKGTWVAARVRGKGVVMVYGPSRQAARRFAEPYARD